MCFHFCLVDFTVLAMFVETVHVYFILLGWEKSLFSCAILVSSDGGSVCAPTQSHPAHTSSPLYVQPNPSRLKMAPGNFPDLSSNPCEEKSRSVACFS